MEEWHRLMVERAHELVAKGNLTPGQVAERTGIDRRSVERMMAREAKRR